MISKTVAANKMFCAQEAEGFTILNFQPSEASLRKLTMLKRLSIWGTIYFAFVFGIGFLLGVLRVALLEPKIGTRWAELFEMPLMLVAIIVSASWIVGKTRDRFRKLDYVGIGFVGLALLLAAEATLVLRLRGISISEYIAGRDPISGSVYGLMLLVFAAMPWLFTWSGTRHRSNA